MSFEQMVEKFQADPRIVVEAVRKESPWRKILSSGRDAMRESDVDQFLAWNKKHPHYYKAFEATTLDAISRGEKLTAIAVMDKIGCDHNQTPGYTRVFKHKWPQHSDYYRTKATKREAA